ncbi:MAG: hypothetical protein AAF587_21850 [Bacteroidota bacterium]
MRSLNVYLLTLVLIILLGGGINPASAQNYGTAIGLRMGYSVGLTVKGHLDAEKAIEGLLYFRSRGLGLTILYEKHADAFGSSDLQWFYGVGGHFGYWNKDRNLNAPVFTEETDVIGGVDGILGIEYTIREIPFCISLDYKPLLNLFGTGEVPRFGHGGALSIRYLL